MCLLPVSSFIIPINATARPNQATCKPNNIIKVTFITVIKARMSFHSNLYALSIWKKFFIFLSPFNLQLDYILFCVESQSDVLDVIRLIRKILFFLLCFFCYFKFFIYCNWVDFILLMVHNFFSI